MRGQGSYTAVNELIGGRCGDRPGAPEAGSYAHTKHTHTQPGEGGDTRENTGAESKSPLPGPVD